MQPDKPRARPTPETGSRETSAPGKATDTATVPSATDAGRELAAWGAAVAHLHRLGLPAAAPSFPCRWLARRGIIADWATAA